MKTIAIDVIAVVANIGSQLSYFKFLESYSILSRTSQNLDQHCWLASTSSKDSHPFYFLCVYRAMQMHRLKPIKLARSTSSRPNQILVVVSLVKIAVVGRSPCPRIRGLSGSVFIFLIITLWNGRFLIQFFVLRLYRPSSKLGRKAFTE